MNRFDQHVAPAEQAAGKTEMPARLRRGTVFLLAAACGLSVANLYFGQPLLKQMAETLPATESEMGLVSSLTQAGYALGLLFFVPLGDSMERRRMILVMLGCVTLAALAVASSPGPIWLAAASLALGAATITPQLLVPLAAGMAHIAERGRVVGTVMSGLLVGILLSRTFSGLVGSEIGWRGVYVIAAVLSVALAVVLRFTLPPGPPATRLGYGRLLASMGRLLRDQPVLRESCVYGAAGFGAFSAFWTTLTFHLARPPFELGSAAVGAFGLLGAAGALSAAFTGRIADRRGPRLTIGLGLGCVGAGFAILWAFGYTLAGLIVGVILVDLGAQGAHISNQTRIYSLQAEFHNRLNTVYMVTFFVGGAAGSALASFAWGAWGWAGVCGVGVAFTALGLGNFAVTARRAVRRPASHLHLHDSH